MSKFIPSIVSVDNLISISKHAKTIVINKQHYVARSESHKTSPPYYSNIIKRFIAACYVLAGKGMVVQYSEDRYKSSEITEIYYK